MHAHLVGEHVAHGEKRVVELDLAPARSAFERAVPVQGEGGGGGGKGAGERQTSLPVSTSAHRGRPNCALPPKARAERQALLRPRNPRTTPPALGPSQTSAFAPALEIASPVQSERAQLTPPCPANRPCCAQAPSLLPALVRWRALAGDRRSAAVTAAAAATASVLATVGRAAVWLQGSGCSGNGSGGSLDGVTQPGEDRAPTAEDLPDLDDAVLVRVP